MKMVILLGMLLSACASTTPLKPAQRKNAIQHAYVEQIVHVQQIVVDSRGKPLGKYYIRERRIIAERKIKLTKEQIAKSRAKQKYMSGMSQ